MNFKAYDILSYLVPGFLAVLMLLSAFDKKYDKDLVVAYTAVAFLLGFLMNSIASWMEQVYFLTWGGKPSSKLLEGKAIWKVPFYHATKAKGLLMTDAANPNATSDELFSIAMRYANGQKDTRVDDFNAIYSFSRTILTTVLIGAVVLILDHPKDWRYYVVSLLVVIASWLRCKQRAYYYSREVLNVYLKSKNA